MTVSSHAASSIQSTLPTSDVVSLQCMGPSMLPTFNTRGDVLLLEHFSTYLRRIEIGDCLFLALLELLCVSANPVPKRAHLHSYGRMALTPLLGVNCIHSIQSD